MTIDRLADEFTGEYQAQGNTLTGDGERLIARNEFSNHPLIGNYTAIYRNVSPGAASLLGFARAVISPAASVTLDGCLPDSTPFTSTTGLTVSGRIPVAIQSTRGGQLFGWLSTSDTTKHIDGDLEWSRPSTTGPSTAVLTFAGRVYTAPANGQPPFPARSAEGPGYGQYNDGAAVGNGFDPHPVCSARDAERGEHTGGSDHPQISAQDRPAKRTFRASERTEVAGKGDRGAPGQRRTVCG